MMNTENLCNVVPITRDSIDVEQKENEDNGG